MTKEELKVQRALGTIQQVICYPGGGLRIDNIMFEPGEETPYYSFYPAALPITEKIILSFIEEHFDTFNNYKYC